MSRSLAILICFIPVLLACSQMPSIKESGQKPSSRAKNISQHTDWRWPLPSNQKRVEFSPIVNGRAYMPSYSGAHVLAVANGEVVFSGKEIKGFGRAVVIKHENDLFSVYGNLKNQYVVKKEKVHQGQVIGRIGPRASREEKGSSHSLGELVFEARHQGRVVSFQSLYSNFQKINDSKN